MYRYLPIILLFLLTAFQETVGMSRYASPTDSINLTCSREQLEKAYEDLRRRKPGSREAEVVHAMEGVALASRIGRFDDIRRYIKKFPSSSTGAIGLDRSVLLAIADYTRFRNIGFEMDDVGFNSSSLPAEVVGSPENRYLLGHTLQLLRLYDECEQMWGDIARDLLRKYSSSPVAQYELEAYLYWIESLIDNSGYEKAEDELRRLPDILSATVSGNPYYKARLHYLEGKLRHILGNSEQGERSLEEAMKTLEERHEEKSLLYPLVAKELGIACMASSKPEKALESFSKYRDVMASLFGKESVAEWDACNYCLDALLAAERFDEFEQLHNQVENFRSYQNDRSHLDLFQFNHTFRTWGMYHLRDNMYARPVASMFETMVKSVRDIEIQDLQLLRSSLNNAGYANVIAEKHDEAIRHFSEQLEIDRKYAREVFSFLPQNLRSAYWERNRMLMNRLFSINRTGSVTLDGGRVSALATDLEYSKTAELLYDGALLNKGIMLQASVSLQRILSGTGDSDLLRLNEELAALRRVQATGRLSQTQEERARDIERRLMKEVKRYGDFMNFAAIRWTDIRDRLKDNEVAVEFICSSDRGVSYYSAEIIRKGFKSPRHVFLFGCREGENIFDRDDIYTSNFLNLKVWKRILKFVNPGETIYFSPDGILHGIAIENVRCGDGERVSSAYNPVRLSSTREIVTEREPSSADGVMLFGGLDYDMTTEDMELVALADDSFRGGADGRSRRLAWNYLPGTYEEVETISADLRQAGGQNVVTFTGMEGTEENFKRISGSPVKTLHIATHGYSLASAGSDASADADYATADRSMSLNALVMSGGNNGWLYPDIIPEGVDDGLLTAMEIASLDFTDTGLVVLSACQTGLGQSSSEGVYGLQRAFKLAGAGTIVMSLAEVHDEATKVLMTGFHRYLQAGLTKREAFAKAQEDVRKETFTVGEETLSGDDPRFWAPFVILD